jgi:hypothetical protein
VRGNGLLKVTASVNFEIYYVLPHPFSLRERVGEREDKSGLTFPSNAGMLPATPYSSLNTA